MKVNEQLLKIFSPADADVKENYFTEVASDNPYYQIAQFNLLQYLKKNNLSGFKRQAQKTALYYKNANWLNWQLHLATIPDENEKNAGIVELQEPDNIISTKTKSSETENLLGEIDASGAFKKSLQDVNTEEKIVAFDPLHTVDYFASQGIKIMDEPSPGDKLGMQMKSFTEWLKSMKKVPAQNLPDTSAESDIKIQNIADASNAHIDVLTEAMAQVLIKQNKLEKAISMYEKLSLINPSKSAYFAAKIESLKSI